jgi:primosomal protein N' (replication factor Y)
MDSRGANQGRPRAEDRTGGAAVAVAVQIPLPFAGAYDYLRGGLHLEPGAFVRVPLGPREVTGVVWGEAAGDVASAKLRPVVTRLPAPPMPEALRAFVDWVASYNLVPRGAVLRLAMSVPQALQPQKPAIGYAATGAPPPRMTVARQRVLEVVANAPYLSAAALAREAAVSASVVRGLVDAGALRTVEVAAGPAFEGPDPNAVGPPLSAIQSDAAAQLRDKVHAQAFSVTLLDGVTGAGKTEVYLDAVAEALRQGRQALVLVPEIALTAQWLERFHRRFGVAPAEWHSELPAARRRTTWRAVADGTARVVVGARSALFLPYPDLGLLVVDEEHDPSYKQEEGVIYHARDMGVVRGRIGDFAVVLVSATPSLESHINAQTGRYSRTHLMERHGPAELPQVTAVDLRSSPSPRGQWLSPVVTDAMKHALAHGLQSLLFLNRRGYAPLTLCRVCGHRFECPDCSAWLVEHRPARRLKCHHCGHSVPRPSECPECGTADSLLACGPGVERVAEEVRALLPDARLAVLASDTVNGPAAAAELVRAVTEREVDVLIGTQIVAKGHHFPHLTVVAVVDADLGLAGGDLRAAERTYQLLSQVSGRAGREEHPGQVFLQTHCPAHPVIAALLSGDRDAFYVREAEDRRAYGMPPFGRLAALIVSGADGGAVERHAFALARAAPRENGVEVLGPAPAPLRLLRGRTRVRLLLKAAKEVHVQAVLRAWLGRVKQPGSVRVQVDVEPVSFL